MTFDVYLSLGSNIDPEHHLRRALVELNRRTDLRRISPVYRTRPVEMEPGSSNFHNLCVKVRTDLEPARLKEVLNEIEEKCGRDRSREAEDPEVYRARTLDVDILLYEPETQGFTPHEQVLDQAFVVFPLSDIREPPPLEGVPSDPASWRSQCDESVILEVVSYDWPREVRTVLEEGSP